MNTYIQQGLGALQTGQIDQAKQIFEKALSLDPMDADATHWLGVIAFQSGQRLLGLKNVDKVLQQQPNNSQFHISRGNMLKEMGRFSEAILAYKQAIRNRSGAADALNNLGVVLAQISLHDEAIGYYEKAIAIVPNYFDAYNNLGVSLKVMGRQKESYEAFWRAVQIHPNFPSALFNLAMATEPIDRSRAIQLAERAVSLVPTFQMAWITLAKWYMENGDANAAKQASAHAQGISSLPGLRIFDALALPAIMGTVDEVEHSRASFKRNLEGLFSEHLSLEDPFMEHCTTNFFLAYHGMNDRELQARTARFYLQASPQLGYTAAHCLQSNDGVKPTRVGLLSPYLTNHAVAASSAGLINGLANDDNFDVTVITTKVVSTAAIKEVYPKLKGDILVLPSGLAASRTSIASLELDVLIYLDIGMEPKTYFLAFSRLARVQCVLGGHPVTTGIPNIDYYLSTDAIEPVDAQEHYTEQLMRLSHGPFYFSEPNVPLLNKGREALGLPESGNIYLCPMTLFKIHPDFDQAINEILNRDKNGSVIFMKDRSHPHYHTSLQERFDRTIAQAHRTRILFISWISDSDDFMRVIDASNVVLDPFHFGIGTTAIQVCSVGTPFITLPGKYMRGRAGLYWSKLLAIEEECVASSVNDYVRKAVEIATNTELRTRIKTKMQLNRHVLFENSQGVDDVRNFLRNCPILH
jgi:protein O-GlcNAc transferase